jgi:multicomponent Na+:H+ antiporter subunit E
MPAEGSVRVAAVVADSSSLDATLASAFQRTGADSADATVTVLCPDQAVSERVATLLDDRGWTASVEVVDPFAPAPLAAAVRAAGAEALVLDPALPFPRSALRTRLADEDVRVRRSPPLGRGRGRGRRPRLRVATGLAQRATIFGLAFGFYLLLGRVDAFDVATGLVAAAAVALVLSRVAFVEPPTLRRTLPRVGRAALFLPYLLWEVARANLSLAVVLLDPRLPIDPSVERLDVEADSNLERAVLANSITLTPGTVAVDVDDSSLVVHTLTAPSRADLREGRLRRAVRRVFAGRRPERSPNGE